MTGTYSENALCGDGREWCLPDWARVHEHVVYCAWRGEELLYVGLSSNVLGTNRDEQRARSAAWKAAHKAEVAAYNASYRGSRPEQTAASRRAAHALRRAAACVHLACLAIGALQLTRDLEGVPGLPTVAEADESPDA